MSSEGSSVVCKSPEGSGGVRRGLEGSRHINEFRGIQVGPEVSVGVQRDLEESRGIRRGPEG